MISPAGMLAQNLAQMPELHEGRWLRIAIENAEVSQAEFARQMGVTLRALQKWLTQDRIALRGHNRAKLARLLWMSVEEMDAAMASGALPRRGKSFADLLAPGLPLGEAGETLGVGGRVLAPPLPPRFKIAEIRATRPLDAPHTRDVPIINSVAAGPLIERTDLDYPAGFADNYVRVAIDPKTHAFGLWVEGESMLPRYEPGDLVVFRVLKAGEPIVDGADYAIQLTGEGNVESTFKRITHHRKAGGVIVANALNPEFRPRSFEIPLSRVARMGHVMMIIPSNR